MRTGSGLTLGMGSGGLSNLSLAGLGMGGGSMSAGGLGHARVRSDELNLGLDMGDSAIDPILVSRYIFGIT
jgi:hypothetical protein